MLNNIFNLFVILAGLVCVLSALVGALTTKQPPHPMTNPTNNNAWGVALMSLVVFGVLIVIKVAFKI